MASKWLRLVVAVLAACAIAAAPATSAVDPSGVQLTFVRNGNVFAAAADGSRAAPQLRRRRDGIWHVSYEAPAWSRRGASLAVMAHFTPPSDSESHPHTILTVIRDGRVADARSAAAYPDSAGSFSPDAARVVYASDAGLNVVALSREGPGSVTRLTPSVAESLAACDETPVWSPDGTHIAFVRCGALSTISPSGGNVRRIVPGRANNPTWSPDGRRIAFDDGRRVRIVARRGGRVRLLAAGTDPAWSPDGATIAAVRNGDVWLVDARSGRARLAVRNASQPAWRPRR